ncbi:Grx4 family monothiol glutaredoxin [Stutzerimonas kirkiae]|uniref:Glutaredoxin n=1 Tax=Stutzerimonas kirkiae TaxID=2211392 RepID=A0A4Q9RDT1_9GAMM|nr:Grx4 family monothiol glutaredoxin [Stutzerimonas kirkiae]TBU98797.1 Grx4 family monothiol glutaredoxin [Stutzerimonas kirkiae]TBV03891.1 Grx4 family monothiol glutaredoxin [Stutzerimonas kirkiae]TBV09695.1 Grx4 family monothiol glutaredoxin [Stutzerimonas kirkiae]TBV16771.1 Grx4 family monothiol glutaredoxin [Stutzerimonas kirkiae]
MQVLDTESRIRQQIADNPVILYMKGNPEAPECGFSRAAVAALKNTGQPFAFVNVLNAPHIREKLPRISQWPTYPQLFVNGELVGGCDIILGMEADGSLKTLLENAPAQG